MELHPAAEVASTGTASGAASARWAAYLDRLGLPSAERRDIAERLDALDAGVDSVPNDTFVELHRAISGRAVDAQHPVLSSQARRLELADPRLDARFTLPSIRDTLGRLSLVSAPPINRTSMVPKRWPRGFFSRIMASLVPPKLVENGAAPAAALPPEGSDADSPDARGSWHRVAAVRHLVIAGLVVSQTYIAANFMSAVLPYHGAQPLEIALLILFTILFAWVSVGFWTAIAGFILLLLGRDRFAISRSDDDDATIDPAARVAIVMPIRNEDVNRVFAGLRATYESLAGTGQLEHFDFFVLSDSSDPDARVAELAGWAEMCRAVQGFGRVYYRWRQHRIKRKSGNIGDFCRRWGRGYRYMVVLDADSVMSGRCLTSLVRMIEANPNAGIIQTAPTAAGRDTFYARVQQFATRVYGPLFTAGLHFWHLGESHYWGHNAIIRLAPFMRHCALRRLPGHGALSGEILSHDYVEAALMRRAGWAVWLAYDLPGSYEEMPPNLVDELKRDRRWCQGNLMNFRLFLMKGLHPAHRAVFMSGVMAYVSALLWFAFLILSTAVVAVQNLTEPEYFVQPYQLFPLWPEWHPQWAIALFGATALLLFLPKLLAVLLRYIRDAKNYGGAALLTVSMLMEFVLSALLAPIRMLFHSQFVVAAFAGWPIQWHSPPREDAQTTWGEALRRHGSQTLLGVGWAAGVYWLDPSFLWWLLPIVGALMLSIPLSVYTSRASIGRRLRSDGLFVIPEELAPPPEIRRMMERVRAGIPLPGFVDAVADPLVNALACAAGAARATRIRSADDERLVRTALHRGPDSLSETEKNLLLGNALALSKLHGLVWSSPDASPLWRGANCVPHRPAANAADLDAGTDLGAAFPAIDDRRAVHPGD
jgi:membrane glycosyltransferase